jgi:hypothetical protein
MSDITVVSSDDAPPLDGTLTNDDGTPFDLTDADEVRFQMRLALDRRFTVDAAADIVSAAAGTVQYVWAPGDLALAGDYVSRWRVLWGDGRVQHTSPENTITVADQ